MKKDFVAQGKIDMPTYVEKAIENLLKILDSKILFPRNQAGDVIEQRLLGVVKSREQVYMSAMNMIDLIDIGSAKFLDRIIQGLKTTYSELTAITTRDFGDENKTVVDEDRMTSIAQAVELSAKVAYSILDRIEKLEMSDEQKTKMMADRYIANTVERYAEN